jgi:hypothetical protein
VRRRPSREIGCREAQRLADRRLGEIHRLDRGDLGRDRGAIERRGRDLEVRAARVGFPVAEHAQREADGRRQHLANESADGLLRDVDAPLTADALQHAARGVEDDGDRRAVSERRLRCRRNDTQRAGRRPRRDRDGALAEG